MYNQGRFRIAVSILVCFMLQAQGADKYTDENRPYEFGFNVEIDGSKQQHRHEKKDKDGIIMGEFGFVTADDVYHVTVYATDKEGRFKILSMKNIHLKSSPGAGTAAAKTARQGHSLALPEAPAAPAAKANAVPQAAPPPQPQAPFKPLVLEAPGRSCSSCSIPTTTRVPPPAPPASFLPPNENAYPNSTPNVQNGGFGSQPYSPHGGSPNYSPQAPAAPFAQNYPQQPEQAQQNYPQQPEQPQQNYPQQPEQPQQNYPGATGGANPNAPSNYPDGLSPPTGQAAPQFSPQGNPQFPSDPSSQNTPQGGAPGRTSKQYTGPEQQFANAGPQAQTGQPGPEKPTLISAQMQIVDKNTDVHALSPGEKHGLPSGLTEGDMTDLLYTFNYTVGFHGHFEEGYRNGAKKGYYFVTGRNGVRTRIDYTADDTGFHPRVSQEVLDLLSDDVPKPETEKDEKYGLKGYEFKWLYYPVESNGR